MKIKFFIFFLFSVFISKAVFSQQLTHFRNNSFNLLANNPSAISLSNIPDIVLNYKAQWTGFEGAPRLSTLAGKYMFRDDMGVGMYIMNDTYGISQKFNISANYVYKLKTNYFDINFGMSWLVTQYKMKGSEITIREPNDVSVDQNVIDKIWRPDANIGILINAKDFYAGISILQIFKTKYSFWKNASEHVGLVQNKRHFMLVGAYMYKLDDKHSFSPQTNMYFTYGAPWKFDLGINYSYDNSFMGSLYFSKGDALALTLGYVYDRYYFTYSFDLIISRIRNVSSGAHEFCLGIYLKKDKKNNNLSAPMY